MHQAGRTRRSPSPYKRSADPWSSSSSSDSNHPSNFSTRQTDATQFGRSTPGPLKRRPASATGFRADGTVVQGVEQFLRHTEKLEMKGTGNGVKVLVRVRPLSETELLAEDTTHAVKVIDDCTCAISPPKDKQRSEEACTFTFDSIVKETATQDDVFERVGVPIVDNVLEGYNSTIFAYGQTGAGKTHTMIGVTNENEDGVSEQGGLAPRAFHYLFKRIGEVAQQSLTSEDNPEELEFRVRCSVLEIYNENITDLLNPKESNLPVRETAARGAYVDGLQEVLVRNANEALQLLFLGASNRKTAHTKANNKSSRSHYMYTCKVERTAKTATGARHTRHSRLNLVDLAGSERNRFSRATNHQLKEACHINQSLSTLGRVIKELLACQRHGGGHIPYRDSKLTYLLQESLGGNAKTTIIANISPSSLWYHETLSTLQFVRRAKHMRNNARVNELSDGKENVEALKMEIQRLRALLRNPNSAAVKEVFQEENELKDEFESHRADELQDLLNAAMESNDGLKEEKKRLEEQVEALLEEVAVLQDDRAMMQNSLKLVMCRFSDAQKTALIADEEAGKLSAMEREVLMRELQKEEIERLQGGEVIEELQLNLATMAQQMTALRDRENEMLLELELAQETMERQQEELEKCHRDLIVAENDKKDQQASFEVVSQQLAREKDASAGLEAALDRTRVELFRARDSACASQDETIRKDRTLESLTRNQSESQKEAEKLQRQVKKLEEDLANLKGEVSRRDYTLAELQQKHEKLKEGYEDLAATVVERDDECQYLQQIVEDASQRAVAEEISNEQIMAQRDQSIQQNFALESIMNNISQVVRDIEVATPPAILHMVTTQDSSRGFEAFDSFKSRFSATPDGMAPRGMVW